jgi:hypothetical protein
MYIYIFICVCNTAPGMLRQVVPVLYALSILLLVTSVYAILASQLYGDRAPEHFGRFSLALFSVCPTGERGGGRRGW